MDSIHGLLRIQAPDRDISPKKIDLVQIIIVIGSGILSSTTIATIVKAWLDSRKTRLTIQIDGETKKVEYEGLYLSQEVSTIQAILGTLDERLQDGEAVNAVTIDMTDDAQQETRLLESGNRDALESRQVGGTPTVPLWRRLLPTALFKDRGTC